MGKPVFSTRSRGILAAAASGVLVSLAFPLAVPGTAEPLLPPSFEMLALVGQVPLVAWLEGKGPGVWFRYGWVAGAVFFSVVLYWLNVALTRFGGLPDVASIPIMALLIGFLACFWGAALALGRWLCGGRPAWQRPLLMAASWTIAEYARNYVLTGFPWASLGSSQARTLWLGQLAWAGGVYLVGFVVAWSNFALARFSRWVAGRGPLEAAVVVPWVVVFAAAGVLGAMRLSRAFEGGDTVKVAIVQGNLDERARLRGMNAQRWVLRRMLERTSAAAKGGARLVVWPEAVLPVPVRVPAERLNLLGLRRPGAMPGVIVAGAVVAERRSDTERLYNSALVLDGELRILGAHHKRHLVPFGEYVPAGRYLPVHWFVPEGVRFFTPGPGHAPVASPAGKLGIMVCYEAIFPEIAREAVRKGAELLVNITNDSWYGATSAPHQHLALAAMRSVETGRWTVRAANTGVSAVIDPCGRITARLPLGLSSRAATRGAAGLEPAWVLQAAVELRGGSTPYVAAGDWICWLSILACLAAAASGLRSRTRRR